MELPGLYHFTWVKRGPVFTLPLYLGKVHTGFYFSTLAY